jgi:hypothetical protein
VVVACHRRGMHMRQWELFGITDSDPTWTPPVKVVPEPEEILRITLDPAEGEEELGVA